MPCAKSRNDDNVLKNALTSSNLVAIPSSNHSQGCKA
jgi:hypothetical protein